MQIVTDSACDLAPEQIQNLEFHTIPLRLILEGKTYRSGLDIQPTEFYQLLASTDAMPTTTQPAPGEFADLYRQLAKTDPDILSIHLGSGLSGTLNAARMGAAMVPEARVTVFDSCFLSTPLGWQVMAAVRAAHAGWTLEKILALLTRLRQAAYGMCTLQVLKYAIHGGRVSHLKGLVGSLLNIKPIISFDKVNGATDQVGQEVTYRRAILQMANLGTRWYKPGTRLLVQLLYGAEQSVTEPLRERMAQLFDCTWLPTHTLAPIFGCHSGPGVAGLTFIPADVWEQVP